MNSMTPEGFEPSTQGLKVLCSTTELRGHLLINYQITQAKG